ncbi:MAG: efflux transporter outer membrane subunit [Burkholderiales bacterium]
MKTSIEISIKISKVRSITTMKPMKFHHLRFYKPLLPMLAGTLLLATGGCAMMRDGPAPLAQIDVQQIRLAEDIKLSRDGWPQAQWWHRYGDSQLDALIEQALKDAPVMSVATSRIAASRAQVSLTDATRGLLVGFSASVDRQDISANSYLGPFSHNIPAEGFTGPWYTEGTLGLSAEYSFDFWGKERAKVDAALGMRNARQAEAAQTELILSARVTQVYFDIQALYVALGLLEQAQGIETDMVSAHAARAERGLESVTQTEMARTHKLELDKQISAAHSRISMLRETLRSLLGAGPDKLPVIKPLSLPDSAGALPSTLGYELLARRPDLQAMRWTVQASQRQIDVAKAAFYPSVDIKSFYGLDALHLDDLLHSSSKQVNLIPGLSLPIFDSGRLNAGLANARTQSNVLIAQYNQSIVEAVREVAQDGIELESLSRQVQIQDAKLKASAVSQDSAEAHYRNGLADKVTAMEAKLPVLLEQGKLNELRNQQIDTEIALTMALGGGYTSDAEDVKTVGVIKEAR